MTDITIPEEVLEAVEAEIIAGISKGLDPEQFTLASCLAMLKAWPGMKRSRLGSDGDLRIILPPHTGEHQ